MDFEDTRAAICDRLDTYWSGAHPEVLVEYENQASIDLNAHTDPFLSCDIVYTDGTQISLGQPGGTRYPGAIWLSSWVKEGGGTAEGNRYLKELADLFGQKAFGGVNTKAARRVPSNPHKGWYVQSLRVPHWFDDI
jgi:hypothetical protein